MTPLLRFLLLSLPFLGMHAAKADDIDIFASGLQSSATAPRILIVLDNTSNWARQSQQWPSRNVCPDLSELGDSSTYGEADCPEIDEQQGQAEVAALKAALAETKSLADAAGFVPKIGILEYTTDGTANQDGGYVRVHMSDYDETQETLFNETLEEIYDEINAPIEKRNSNTAYGNLMYDIYNYLAGTTQSFSGLGTPTGSDGNGNVYPDSRGYSTNYSVFSSPLDDGDICAETFVIFISNPNQSGPATDSDANSTTLRSLYTAAAATPAALAGDGSGTGLQMPEFIEVVGSGGGVQSVGFTSACFERVQDCDSSINGLAGESADITAACPAGGACDCTSSGQSTVKPNGDACPVEVRTNPQGKVTGTTQYYSYDVLAPSSGSDGQYYQSNGLVDGIDYNMDDWTKYLHDYGIEVETGDTVTDDAGNVIPETASMTVTTFTIDVYNAAPDTEHSALMASAANQGGGYRLKAGNYAELKNALTRILSDILAVNSTFAAVSLPLSAANQTLSENQVFVASFRPAQERKPRWPGNLKLYQLALFDGVPGLADANLNSVINPETGFARGCSTSFWTESTSNVTISQDGGATTETGGYFTYLDSFDPAPESECTDDSINESPWSDMPDGPFVEKGGVAQQIRMHQQLSGASTRTVFTVPSSGTLTNIQLSPTPATLPSGLTAAGAAFLIGESPAMHGGDTIEDAAGTQTPPAADPEVMPEVGLAATVHGDVVHSTPLSVTYGEDASGETVFRIFYGANDGLYRAVNPVSGREDWAFIAPDHLDRVERIYQNTVSIEYSNTDLSSLGVVDEPKPYFFDGSTGLYTEYASDGSLTTGYIYPSMRRGGRQFYAMNICDSCSGTPPTQPEVMWKAGCDDAGSCADGIGGSASELADMGQTWSTPYVEKVNGYANPVVIMGGGWNSCLDADTADLSSACTKDTDLTNTTGGVSGSAVFVFDAVTGELLVKWDTEYPVVAEVIAVDMVGEDRVVDVAYAVDAGGSLYRLGFVDAAGSVLTAASAVADWTMVKVAGTTSAASDNQRFFSRPALASVVSEGKEYTLLAYGSGDREKPLRTNYPVVNSLTSKFYAVIDRIFDWNVPNDGVETALGLTDAGRVIDLDDLAPASGANDTNTFGMLEITQNSQETTDLRIYDGWVFELPDAGERVVNPAVIAGGTVFFNSYNPVGEQAACAALGNSRGYQIGLQRPGAPSVSDYEPGFPIPPVVAIVKDLPCVGECGSASTTTPVVIGADGTFIKVEEPLPANQASVREVYRAENTDLQ